MQLASSSKRRLIGVHMALGHALSNAASIEQPAFCLVELFGIDLGGLITLTTTTVHLWFLALGIVLLRRKV